MTSAIDTFIAMIAPYKSAAIAEAVEVNIHTARSWQRGETVPQRCSTALRLAQHLRVDAGGLLHILVDAQTEIDARRSEVRSA